MPQTRCTSGFAVCASFKTTLLGGRWWMRTTEGVASRFTVCPLWPLGKSPILNSSDDGAGGRTRTPDLLITNQLLYRLSYTGILFNRLRKKDYNRKHLSCQQEIFKN